MKKIFSLFLLLQLFATTNINAVNKILLNVKFDSAPNGTFYNQPLHLQGMLALDPNKNINQIVKTQSQIVHNFPATVALLVRCTKFNNDEVHLQFNLVHYSFYRNGSIITQPQIKLKNGQVGEMRSGVYHLKVIAKWSE